MLHNHIIKFYTFTIVSKLISISISIIILMQSFGIHVSDISQIDEFVEHAQYHNEQYGDNIVVFIAKHYGELKAEHSNDHQEEKDEHEELPFQHQSHITSIPVFVVNSQKAELKLLEPLEFKKHNFFYQAPSSSLHCDGLFQPPKFS